MNDDGVRTFFSSSIFKRSGCCWQPSSISDQSLTPSYRYHIARKKIIFLLIGWILLYFSINSISLQKTKEDEMESKMKKIIFYIDLYLTSNHSHSLTFQPSLLISHITFLKREFMKNEMTCAGYQKQPSGKITNIYVDMMMEKEKKYRKK